MIDYEEDWLAWVVFRWRGSAAPRALWFALPSALLAPLLLFLDDRAPDVREGSGLEAVSSSVLWASTTGCVVFLMGFRSQQALGRFWEGTGLLHQMRGEWFESASCLMTFSRKARGTMPTEVSEFRHALVRLMSLMHGSALEEIKPKHNDQYGVIDIRGLDPTTRTYLKECKDELGFNRVEILLHMVQVLITQNLDDGVLNIDPPILSRVYQTMSRGLVNLLNARKITDTRFPLPYVQLFTILLMFHSLLTPVVITTIVQHKVWATLFTFVPVFGLFSMNFVAIELECPFGDDENDLPLGQFQEEFNTSLLMLISDEADHLVGTSPNAIRSMRGLARSLHSSKTTSLEAAMDRTSYSSDVLGSSVNNMSWKGVSQVLTGGSGSGSQSDAAPHRGAKKSVFVPWDLGLGDRGDSGRSSRHSTKSIFDTDDLYREKDVKSSTQTIRFSAKSIASKDDKDDPRAEQKKKSQVKFEDEVVGVSLPQPLAPTEGGAPREPSEEKEMNDERGPHECVVHPRSFPKSRVAKKSDAAARVAAEQQRGVSQPSVSSTRADVDRDPIQMDALDLSVDSQSSPDLLEHGGHGTLTQPRETITQETEVLEPPMSTEGAGAVEGSACMYLPLPARPNAPGPVSV